MSNSVGPKVLILDIESAPILSYTWGLFQQDVGLNQIHSDWFVMSWAAKFLGKDKIYYQDQRKAKNIEDDKPLLQGIWDLMNDCDILIGQNSKGFDCKKLNARFVINGMKPPSSYRHLDTLLMAKKHFQFTSNKLEYLSGKLCNQKKNAHKNFPGFELWRECLKGNQRAWRELKTYNIQDVLATEELFKKLYPYDNSINFNLYRKDLDTVCHCGNAEFSKWGFRYTGGNKYQRLICTKCGSESRSKINELSPTKRDTLRKHG